MIIAGAYPSHGGEYIPVLKAFLCGLAIQGASWAGASWASAFGKLFSWFSYVFGGSVRFADKNVRAPLGVAVWVVILFWQISGFGSTNILQIDSKPVTLFTNQMIRGTVLFFVAPECPIANRYAPIMEDLRNNHGANFNFWIVYSGAQEQELILQHQKEFLPKFQALVDPKFELTDLAQARRTPQTAVFNRAGKLTYTGRIDDRAADFGKWRQIPTEFNLENALKVLSTNQNIRLPSAPPVGCSISR